MKESGLKKQTHPLKLVEQMFYEFGLQCSQFKGSDPSYYIR